ncbi:MAG: bifunctional (p)ppGpp synthetase/guanosine-3',5'-bis(diphosphate) 3'-pyrophosphohydrolase [Candidatus Lernaella stagnicola]|nr:bifunctional (p)ppGpp synthetase/guanosine-3',5'-bis(diphosphate) 3'-pyrophosphohydrolase [Candidatus Lernaella stagnicola]
MQSLDTLLPRKVRPDDIIREVRRYLPNPEVELIRRAYVFAMHHHEGQKRYSGHAYIEHPIAVAFLLAKMRMDEVTIATGLLHDTLEDCANVDKPLIQNLFGEEIAELVDGVSKISQMKFSSLEHRQAENFKKILVATAQDIRVLLVKLADRLHNMYTLEFVPREKRGRIARETSEIYSPLAHRLGMQWVKSALEDFSFRYLNPDAYYNLVMRLSEGRKVRDLYIEETIGVLRKLLTHNNIQAEISGRVKSLHSIYKKMQAQRLSFDEVMDIIAFRIVLSSVAECYEVLGLIHSQWRPVPGRIKDYIAMPKANMYQSLHTTVIGPKSERMEVQIRTWEIHRVAELGIAAHWRYKSGGPDRDGKEFGWLRQIMEWHKESDDPRAFLSGLKMDLFSEEVYVFTPKGDVLNFPKGATPLDFAYRIHTQVGHTTVGAKVNGRIVPLRYELQSGDRVEIVTRKDQTPSRDWLQLVKTGTARAKIRAFLKAEERERSLAAGRQMLEKALLKYKVSLNRMERSGRLREVAEKFNFRDADTMVASLGYGKLSVKYILAELVEPEKLETEPEESAFDRLLRPLKRRKAGGIKIHGIDDVLFRMAKCCNPVPGEAVVGFVTRGQGISVHRADCLNALDQPEERRVDVEWDLSGDTKTVPTEIMVTVSDRKGVLAEITNRLAMMEVNIHEIHSGKSTSEESVELHFLLPIRDIAQLDKILQDIRKLPGVLAASRMRY